METIERLLNNAFDLGIQLFIATIVIMIGLKLIKVLEQKLKKENRFSKLDNSVKGFVSINGFMWKCHITISKSSIYNN